MEVDSRDTVVASASVAPIPKINARVMTASENCFMVIVLHRIDELKFRKFNRQGY